MKPLGSCRWQTLHSKPAAHLSHPLMPSWARRQLRSEASVLPPHALRVPNPHTTRVRPSNVSHDWPHHYEQEVQEKCHLCKQPPSGLFTGFHYGPRFYSKQQNHKHLVQSGSEQFLCEHLGLQAQGREVGPLCWLGDYPAPGQVRDASLL